MKLSVLLAVYNGEKYLRECIDSIINQTYENWELIIVNDGSTDKTEQIIDEYKDSRIHIINQANFGLAYSLNIAAKKANGDILVRQDADDISEPMRFAIIYSVFASSNDCVMFASNAKVIDEDGLILYEKKVPSTKQSAIKQVLKLQNPFIHGTLAFKSESFFKLHGYDEGYPTSQDFDFIVKLLSIGSATINQTSLYRLRLHSESVTARKFWRQIMYLNSFSCSIRRFLKLNVRIEDKCTFLIKRLFVLLFFSKINRKSLYFYQLGRIMEKQEKYNDAHKYYKEAAAYSKFNFISRYRVYKKMIFKL